MLAVESVARSVLRQEVERSRVPEATSDEFDICKSSDVAYLQSIVNEPFKQAVSDLQVSRQAQNRVGGPAAAAKPIDAEECEQDVLRNKEQAMLRLADLYVKDSRADKIELLFDSTRSIFEYCSKARIARITKILIDKVGEMANGSELQIPLCKKCIDWCVLEKRTFLRHRMEAKLASLYFQTKKYHLGLQMLPTLLSEVKKMDEKILLVEIYVLEAKLSFYVKRIAKAKAALVAARTNANGIHCPPQLQAEIDIVSGVLHAEENDFQTAYSYFYESYENYLLQKDPKYKQALKYMLLCCIMTDSEEDLQRIEKKQQPSFSQPDIKCFLLMGKAYRERSLKDFEILLKDYHTEIYSDEVIAGHIETLVENLLGKTILQIIEPYSSIEIGKLSELASVPESRLQGKLAEMILDGALNGTLDQAAGILIIFDQPPISTIYENCSATISIQHKIVNVLFQKAAHVL